MSWFEPAGPLLPDIIRNNAAQRGQQPALLCAGRSISWQQLGARCNRVANGFADLGLVPGDRVAMLMQNSVEMLELMLGVIGGGFVAVPMNVAVADDGIARQVSDCDARALVVSPEHRERVAGMTAQLPSALQQRLLSSGPPVNGWRSLSAVVDPASARDPAVRIAPGHPCNIIYSSGTTGLPKGIVHSHGCRMAWAYDMSIALRYHSDARTLITLGLYSNITWVSLLSTLLCGGTLILQSGFDVSSCLQTIEAEAVTHTAMVPVQFQRMMAAEDFDTFDLGSLYAVMCCGSPLHADLKKTVLERLPGSFIELYGLTEGLVTIQSPADAAANPGSVGRPCPGQRLQILDNNDQPLPAGEAGEIVGHGRLLMNGYLNRDEANDEATWVDAEGCRWLRTGDIGRLDEGGNLYLVDRKKDMIISGGQNIYPADIERVVATHRSVAEVAVIGVPSERWGESPVAVVTGNNIQTDELLAWINQRVGRQQRIAAVTAVDELPRNPNGKVLKRELRLQFANLLRTDVDG